MKPYAVIETGGKQYRVEQNSIVQVERLPVDAGSQVELDRVLALSDGSELEVGTPYLEGQAVTAVVMEHFRGPKVVSFKYKKRKGYHRKQGHRQELTKLKIQALTADGASDSAVAAQPEPAEPRPVESAPLEIPPVEAAETLTAPESTPDEQAPVETTPVQPAPPAETRVAGDASAAPEAGDSAEGPPRLPETAS